MRGGVALTQGLRVAYGVLLLGAAWLALTASGVLGGWAKDLGADLPPILILMAVLAIPALAAFCSLRLRIDWRIRIALLLVLLVCVPFLPLAFASHPVIVTTVVTIFVIEQFVIIPFINRRWIGGNSTSGLA
jgi:hypothetical protein